MKRIYILLLACMGTMSVMAQGQKLKSRIIDKDYYPVDSAKVTLKGTNISTVTDKNGNFVLENVPLILDSIQIQKGKKDYTAGIPVVIRMRKAVMDRFAWMVRAGYELPMYDFESVDGSSFFVGVGVDLKMSRHWAFQPSVNLSIRKFNGSDVDYDEKDGRYAYGDMVYNAGVLEVPMLFALKYAVGYSSNIIFRFGPYVDLGLWGDATYTPNSYYSEEHREMTSDIYGSRFGGGIMYGLGVEIGRFLVSTIGHTGWIPNDNSGGAGYTSFGLEIGYKF